MKASQLCTREKGMEEERGAGVMSVRIWRGDCCARGGMHMCEECWAEIAWGGVFWAMTLGLHLRELN